MNLRGGNQASSPSTRGCTVIPPPDRMPLLPRGHCEAQLYLVIAKRVPLLSLRGAQPFPVIARSAATKQSPSKGIATPCIQRGAGLAMTDVRSLRGAVVPFVIARRVLPFVIARPVLPFVIARPEGPKQSPGRRRLR